ncbi:hypothetical protein T492DRAFT_1040801 [Pavlovales sp. CCMP2436]|nr:hypothetical protein T492DRAFT_1040801 [Pavlovales sp. CCMP2436]
MQRLGLPTNPFAGGGAYGHAHAHAYPGHHGYAGHGYAGQGGHGHGHQGHGHGGYHSGYHGGGHGGYGQGQRRRPDDNVDIDNMTHEEILALSERIGSVRVGLTRKQLHTLPLGVYRRPRGAAAGEEPPSCVICLCELEEGSEVRTLLCKHIFHRECVDKWLTSDNLGAKACPVCMAEVKLPTGHPKH